MYANNQKSVSLKTAENKQDETLVNYIKTANKTKQNVINIT